VDCTKKQLRDMVARAANEQASAGGSSAAVAATCGGVYAPHARSTADESRHAANVPLVKAVVCAAHADHCARVAAIEPFRSQGATGSSDGPTNSNGGGALKVRLRLHSSDNCGLHVHPPPTLAEVPASSAATLRGC
jgi:hypothetical protein